ncbi:MAG TPA: endolytic transglycosylase MltG [Solirubrobacterales bacterium]|jgi:UPF0755 protein
MAEDWLGHDPFSEEDPAAAQRERRRHEREERRRGRSVRIPPKRALTVAAVLVALAAAAVAAGEAYRHFHEEAPPPVVARTISVTIPEGYSREQTAAVAREAGLRGSYMKASVHSPFLNPAKYGGAGARNLEGFLFPDTFELERGAPASDLVQLQLRDFKRRIAGVDMSYARSKNLTTYDVLTIASMVEREAQLESERPLIAAVIYNRLHEGMTLGIDATIRFATGNYTEPLSESELAVDSPYNTRLNSGLPPGPIGNPGLASIEAAARPAKVDYLFYVVKPGTCGEHSFTASEAQFDEDVARYEEAREAAGGQSPDTCGE